MKVLGVCVSPIPNSNTDRALRKGFESTGGEAEEPGKKVTEVLRVVRHPNSNQGGT